MVCAKTAILCYHRPIFFSTELQADDPDHVGDSDFMGDPRILRRIAYLHSSCSVVGNIHMGTAIVCICLPKYRPLLRHISQVLSSAWSSYSKQSLQRHVDDEVDIKYLTTRAKTEHV